MASLILGIVGYSIGGPIGGLIGSAVGNVIDASLIHQPDRQGPRVSDLKVQTSTYGASIPWMYGTMRMAGNVIWSTDLVEHSTTQDVGGKGGGGAQVTTFTYTVSCAVSICANQITGVRRIWADSKLIFDASETNTGPISWSQIFQEGVLSVDGSTDNLGGITVYLGTEDQNPDPTIEAALGVGNATAYRGQAYVVFKDFQLQQFGNRMPSFSFEVVGTGSKIGTLKYYQTNVFVQPNGNDGTSTAWSYNPLLNEVWLIGSPVDLGAGRSGTPIARINPDTDTVVGLVQPYLSLPSPIGQFDEIVYNSKDGTFLLNGDANFVSPGDGRCKVDALTGTVLSSKSGSSVFIPELDPGTGDYWGIDDSGNSNLTHVSNKDMTTVATFSNLPFTIGPSCFATDGTLYVCDLNFISIWTVDKVTGGTNMVVVGKTSNSVSWNPALTAWTYNGKSWYAQDLAYDPRRDVLWVWAAPVGGGDQQRVFQFDRFTGSLLKAYALPSSYGAAAVVPTWGKTPFEKFFDEAEDAFWVYKFSSSAGLSDGTLSKFSATDFTQLEATAANVSQSNNTPPNNHTLSGTLFFTYFDKQVPPTNGGYKPARWTPGRIPANKAVLGDIVSDICLKSALLNSQIDTSQLTDLVDGYAVTRQSKGSECIKQLMQAYFFDGVESDLRLKFVKRGASPLVSILDDDLAARHEGDKLPDLLTDMRQQEIELPKAYYLVYESTDHDFQQATQLSKRVTGASGEQITVQLPIAMVADKARSVVEVLVYGAWTARTVYQWSTSFKYDAYEPTDVVTVRGRTVRVTKKDEAGVGLVHWEGVEENPSLYGQTVHGPGGLEAGQTIKVAGNPRMFLLDCALLRDTDDGAGFYAAMGPTTKFQLWTGAELFKSTDGDQSYFDTHLTFVNEVGWGVASKALGSYLGGGNNFDEADQLDVTMVDGTPTSGTTLSVLNGGNAALLANGSGWEVLQFRDVVQNADGSFSLRGLLRGRRGTEWAVAGHAVGDTLVLLTTATVRRVTMQTSEIGVTEGWKAVSLTSTASTARDFVDNAVGLKPYAPVLLGGGRNAAGDVTVTWKRRTRTGGEWRDAVDAALGETTESYDVEVWNSSFTTLKRTFAAVAVQTVTYTAAQQVTDFGSAQATVYLRVFQNSSTVGRGYKLEGSV